MDDMEIFNSDAVGALEDFGRGARRDTAKLSKKIDWLSCKFGKKPNFLVLLKYLITRSPDHALPFQAKNTEIAVALRAKDQAALDAIRSGCTTTEAQIIPPRAVSNWLDADTISQISPRRAVSN
jgi:hypothetical protein